MQRLHRVGSGPRASDRWVRRSGGAGLSLVAGLAVAAVAALAILFVARNQERRTIDESVRHSAGGSFVRLGDGVVHYEVAGPETATLVVLVHGFSVPAYIWDTTFAALKAQGFHVVRYDEYGRGFSDRPRVPYDSALFVRQIDQLLDSLHVSQPVELVGLSMGGRVVASYAVSHPRRVRAVVFIDPAYGSGTPPPPLLSLPLIGEYIFAVRVAPGMPASQLSDFAHPDRHPDWAQRYRTQMRYTGFRQAILSTLRESGEVDDRRLYQRFGTLGIPSLLIWGRQDSTVHFSNSDSMRVRIPGVQFLPVDDAGHLPHIEHPEVVEPVLSGFLKAHADTTR